MRDLAEFDLSAVMDRHRYRAEIVTGKIVGKRLVAAARARGCGRMMGVMIFCWRSYVGG